ncbi:SusD/RagB family nutrient-binding outer membrane lipoprotein [Solitalea canadensis]|uniref:Starch-binding associating with outer membrane n=1 Tax=Solitalea canadensis (strain ATCC 29591 / DSM 3403 / JCM 21819 / LMG 8368 / NBRC 15130 / NCIMB 12057 / USAM 9D) TaxID=929556 RepID=H8KV92_SOLCM|nr:SusD/RagB family nutrient-binding outer membrane lipoprotein [Solitalea canadensis]AFD06150.1 hypothetical protein Solca_1042 [Solitalea canadensis DSM 3403]
MKFRNIKYLVLSMSLTVVATSCNSLLDINDDPEGLKPNQVAISGLLPANLQYTANSYWNVGQYGNYYTQYFAGNSGQEANIDSYNPYGFDNIWESSYLKAMPNIKEMITRGEKEGAPHYAGIGRLLMALNLMQCTDIWGDVPYKEAFQGSANLMPKYDTQQEVYTVHLKALLDQAIVDLLKPNPTAASQQVGTTDLVYGGKTDKWLKAAYAARARYYIHLSKKDPANFANALADAAKAIDNRTGADDLQLKNPGDRTISTSWYMYLSQTAAASRAARPSTYIVNLLNGDAAGVYPGLVDPRISKLVDKGNAASYVGRPVGSLGNQNNANLTTCDITASTYYGAQTAVTPFVTYSEIQFIKAEALFATDKTLAYAAYLEGIRSNMVKLGVETSSIDAYVNDPKISKGDANLTLSDIMLQKYIALFLQMESWTDMRRYQYDTNIYKGLQKPIKNLLGTEWVQRGNYPDNEPGRNVNVPKVANQAVKIWLFQ